MINPDHLIELADSEINSPGQGAPRQTVLCRAVSSAYYALFHRLSQQITWTFAPNYAPKSSALFYRALEHRRTYERCRKVGRDPLPREEGDFFEFESFPAEIRHFANEFVRLQEIRHSADYDKDFKITKALAQEVIDSARSANQGLSAAEGSARAHFLSYLMFGLRG